MADVCTACHRPGGICNRAVCGLERTLTAVVRLGSGENVTVETTIPANVHRGRAEADMLKSLNNG